MSSCSMSTSPFISTEEKPSWLKIRMPTGEAEKKYEQVKLLTKSKRLHTICVEAKCPNMNECWSGGTATFLLMGDICTRYCRFCATKSARAGVPMHDLADEPENLAAAVDEMKLEYIVLTSVDRDDLADQGSEHFAKCVRAVKQRTPHVIVETLIPDFRGDESCIARVADAKPDVISHNLETVRELQGGIRDRRANYEQSLSVLASVKRLYPHIFTKSALMLGLGERDEQIKEAMDDLRAIDCDILTLGQYLQPSRRHLAVKEFIRPDKFRYWEEVGKKKGFLFVAAGPFVRSSYRAGEFFIKNIVKGRAASS